MYAVLASTLMCAVLLRIFLVILGEAVDQSQYGMKYTDIDYNVFTDASRLMWDGKSPYDRDTYRYPPLLSFLLIPTIFFPFFGKIIFCLADIGILWQHFSISEFNPNPNMHTAWRSAILALNISLAVISTRGSSDSIHIFFVLCALKCSFAKQFTLCGVLLGISIHMRIYPIIYIPALLLHISRSEKKKEMGSCTLCPVPAVIMRLFDVDPHVCFIDYSPQTVRDAIRFLIGMCASCGCCSVIAYYFYGWDYLENAVLYHFKRLDARHNFSPHFYWLYLSDVSISSREMYFLGNIMGGALIRPFLTFFPQLVLLSLITLSLARRDICVCFFLLSYTLVTFNKVSTAQYFTWFACFLPDVVARFSWGLPFKSAMVTWIASLLFWLKNAHGLEFGGSNNFSSVWMGCLVFHIINCSCITYLILKLKDRKTLNS